MTSPTSTGWEAQTVWTNLKVTSNCGAAAFIATVYSLTTDVSPQQAVSPNQAEHSFSGMDASTVRLFQQFHIPVRRAQNRHSWREYGRHSFDSVMPHTLKLFVKTKL